MKSMTLHQSRQGFKLENQVVNKSPGTIGWYEDKLDEFENWLLGQSLDQQDSAASPLLSDITSDTIKNYILYLQGRKTTLDNHPYCKPRNKPLSPYTIRGSFRSLSKFFNWAVSEGLISKSPMEKMTAPKVPKSVKPRFSQEEIEKLLKACDEYTDVLASRNRCIIKFLLSTGVRASELCGMTLEDLDIEHGRARIMGKGAIGREVHFGQGTQKELWKYVTIFRMSNSATDHVFLTREGKPLVGKRLQHILIDIGQRAGVPDCHPHKFRHTSIRLKLRNGADLPSVMREVGHSSLATTQIYAQMEREDVEIAMRRTDPVDNWGLK
ncbi:MAG: tyrosine-type recombinase/integrase [Chloroflexi bacterium]|nr:tyrosine-type recombinase/integrase [Chloroflexota bacterium]